MDIKYRSLENQLSQRIIEPFALYSTQENWLLIAFCQLRNDFRAFRLDRIEALKVMNDIFEPHRMTLPEYFQQCMEKFLNTPDIRLS